VREADHHYVSPGASKSEAGTRAEAAAKAAKRDELILVVEDHSINQEVAMLLLEDLGFSAHIANNGRHALDLLQDTSYSLIFMDCQMPELDGFGATSAIRKSETRTGKRVPIVAMTAHALEGSREQCLAAGMDDYLSKPIDPDLLQGMVEKWLPSQAVSRPSTAKATATASDHAPPIDLEALANRYGKTRMGRILEPFRTKDAPKLIASIKQHLTDESLAELLSATHGLKGSSGTAFAIPIRKLCIAIESAGKEKDWTNLSPLVSELEKEFQRLELFLDEWQANAEEKPANKV
jgi:CheY-like chemotaxis protein